MSHRTMAASRTLAVAAVLVIWCVALTTARENHPQESDSDDYDEDVYSWKAELLHRLHAQEAREANFVKWVARGGKKLNQTIAHLTAVQRKIEKFWEKRQIKRQFRQRRKLTSALRSWQAAEREAVHRVMAADPLLEKRLNRTLQHAFQSQDSALQAILHSWDEDLQRDLKAEKRQRGKQAALLEKWQDDMKKGLARAGESVRGLAVGWLLM